MPPKIDAVASAVGGGLNCTASFPLQYVNASNPTQPVGNSPLTIYYRTQAPADPAPAIFLYFGILAHAQSAMDHHGRES